MKNIAIIGAAGYTGGELMRILVNHPMVNIAFAHSKSQAGKPVYFTHTDLLGDTNLLFTNDLNWTGVDAAFLCVGHGEAKKFLAENEILSRVKLIDLSQDHRLISSFEFGVAGSIPNTKHKMHNWIYGLPELNKEAIQQASYIANPGCFATAIQLALLPLANKGLLNNTIHITATTGSTGAGQGLNATSHFSWRNNNVSAYKAFGHQHQGEINQSLKQLQTDYKGKLNFVPLRGDFTRGIFASTYTKCALTQQQAIDLFESYYENHPFVHISHSNIDLKQVVNTNKCLIYIEKHGDKLHLVSVIDNLLKGASGQAVQNMNLMFGWEETEGLRLKAVGF